MFQEYPKLLQKLDIIIGKHSPEANVWYAPINLHICCIPSSLYMFNSLLANWAHIAKDAIISSINMSLDMPGRIIDQYLFHNISDLDLIDERISQYKTVSLKDIKIVAKKIKSNTIYVLEGDTHEKN